MASSVIVIGGGVNGLTAACYLAKAGRDVTLLCEEDSIGGMCATHEFHPGFTSPGVLSDTSMFREWIVRDLRLEEHGLAFEGSSKAAVLGKERRFVLSDDVSETAEEIGRVSKADAGRYREFAAFYERIRPPVERLLNNIPPNIVDPVSGDLLPLLRYGLALRRLGKKDMLEVLRLAPMTVYDWLDEWFENDELKAALALPAVTESYAGPWSPGTNANLLIRRVTAGRGFKGGATALVEALVSAAKGFGIRFETGAGAIAIRPGEGVETTAGDLLEAKTIVASCGPKKVFLEMMRPHELSHRLERRIVNFRTRGLSSQLLLAVDGTISLPGGADRAVIADDLDAIEKAFDPVKYGEVSDSPCLEIYLASQEDPELAPKGKGVVSVMVHYTPYDLRGGWTEEAGEELTRKVIRILEERIPELRDAVVGRKLLTPKDIEQRYGVSGGQIYEGEHALDQLLVRPSPECAMYETPFEGLFLCSGGSFPGGGLTGAPGALAARAVLNRRSRY
ncbi:MAG: NAD(P)/FAD-dependent oxidoreductase [Acidobacteriota bacterium]|nr:MAG: NAD(P)/FAD-dependent oxidoreductase [Acidobacteriota bacterium]